MTKLRVVVISDTHGMHRKVNVPDGDVLVHCGDFCGHGLGRLFHDMPNILHYGRSGEGIELRQGMFFTVEPMINLGRPQVKVLSDGWTAVTRDRSLSAQFEHTIGITSDGCEIFTLSPAGYHRPPHKS